MSIDTVIRMEVRGHQSAVRNFTAIDWQKEAMGKKGLIS